MVYILFNPLSNNGRGKKDSECLDRMIVGDKKLIDITSINIRDFYEKLEPGDEVIISGGDGTLNRFINEIYDVKREIPLKYYSSGTGNDFARDVKEDFKGGFVLLNKYIDNLPKAVVKGRTYRFLNNVSFGLDGYCCERSDEIKATTGKNTSYVLIALKGLFFSYKNTNAIVTVDGVTKAYTDVLMCPSMKGRYYGGGVKIAPNQDRMAEDHKVTVVIVHNLKKIRIPYIFPKIFAGKHVKHTDIITTITGRDVRVVFDRPSPMQIDGETISGVTEYTVSVD